ncbi:hypothetical protein P279_20255 [Rhodobacteraceae bacterium PD-2]|nr:hypothetical protein P279_20255 [Rhodobacteraceae bacterium PD-2]
MTQDGRLRLTHGPIDVIVTAEGGAKAVRTAFHRAAEAFRPLLSDLVAELPRLRSASGPMPRGVVAQHMTRATAPFAPAFVTPMATVAGAVADHLLAAILTPGHGLDSLTVNNGGDIALWSRTRPLTAAICDNPAKGTLPARVSIAPGQGIGGIATSGRHGRSHSLGIADAVTVLAREAATADAAATFIANAVDLPGHPAILRRPARDLSPDSDLGTRLVTTGLGPITAGETQQALAAGVTLAEAFATRGLIAAAFLSLNDHARTVGGAALAAPSDAPQREPLHA